MSNETDLDLLARNVHVWVPNELLRMKPCDNGNGKFRASWCYSGDGGFTKSQWLARRAELQNKPRWDHEAVPAWATALAQDQDGEWKWLGDNVTQYVDGFTADKIRAQCKGVVLGSWRDTLEKRPYISATNCTVTSLGSFGVTVGAPADLSEQAVTARLQEATDNVLAAAKELKCDKYKFDPFISIEDNQGQEMNHDKGWLERGELPPVGSECIFEPGSGSCYFNEYDLKASGEVVKIIAHTRYKHSSCDVAVFRWDLDGCFGVSTGNTKAFRPIRTESEVAIEEMQSDIAERWANCEELARHLVDKGWVKAGK